MAAFARLVLVGLVALTVVYLCLSLYFRAACRERLGREWDEEIAEGDRDAFVQAGLAEYEGSLRRRLILGVYVVPVAVVAAIIYGGNDW